MNFNAYLLPCSPEKRVTGNYGIYGNCESVPTPSIWHAHAIYLFYLACIGEYGDCMLLVKVEMIARSRIFRLLL